MIILAILMLGVVALLVGVFVVGPWLADRVTEWQRWRGDL